MQDDLIYILKHDLSYNGTTEPILMERSRYWRLKKWDGRFLYERCGESKYRAEERQILRDQYSKAIQKKYGVNENWEQNRYFVEQVRPTI